MQQTNEKRQAVVDMARTVLETPFRHQGRTPLGLDCVGLIMYIGVQLGHPMPVDYGAYRRAPKPEEFLRLFNEYMVRKRVIDMAPGDCVLLRDNMFTTHCCIYDIVNGQENIIHALAPRRRVLEEPFDEYYKGRATWCFAYPGVDD